MSENNIQSALPLEVLAKVLSEIIDEIRSNDSVGKSLKTELKNLEKIGQNVGVNFLDNLYSSRDPKEIFDLYEQTKKVSIEIRKLLSNFIEIADYDKITYAFYYKGKRYAVDELNAEWLRASSSKGTLYVNLSEVEKNLSSALVNDYQAAIQSAFNQHYATFLNAIKGTYNGIIGRKGALNLGHIAEAYEIHIEEHHPEEYRALNNLYNSTDTLTVADKMLIAFDKEADAVNYWNNHEGIGAAWMHIRNSLGTQKGTVAGDVLDRQVKQGKDANSARLRLAKMNTLMDGISAYSKILDVKTPSLEVGMEIAKYISEPIYKMSDKIIDQITDENIREQMRKANDSVIKCTVKV